jgi:hypothetical protein
VLSRGSGSSRKLRQAACNAASPGWRGTAGCMRFHLARHGRCVGD